MFGMSRLSRVERRDFIVELIASIVIAQMPRTIVHAGVLSIVSAMLVMVMMVMIVRLGWRRRIIVILRRVLSRLFTLATFHFGFLKQTPFLR